MLVKRYTLITKIQQTDTYVVKSHTPNDPLVVAPLAFHTCHFLSCLVFTSHILRH